MKMSCLALEMRLRKAVFCGVCRDVCMGEPKGLRETRAMGIGL